LNLNFRNFDRAAAGFVGFVRPNKIALKPSATASGSPVARRSQARGIRRTGNDATREHPVQYMTQKKILGVWCKNVYLWRFGCNEHVQLKAFWGTTRFRQTNNLSAAAITVCSIQRS